MARTASVVHPIASLQRAGRRPLLWWLACCCLALRSTPLAAELPPGTVDYPDEMPFNPSITMVDMQLNHATRWGLPSPKVTGEQGWYFNQGAKTGLTEDFFTLGHLTASVR